MYINYKLKLRTRRQQDLEVNNSTLHKNTIYITYINLRNYGDFVLIRTTDFDV